MDIHARDTSVPQDFGNCLRDARLSKGYSQRELAKLVGVSYTYLSKLENNKADYPPKEDVIESLAQHLDLDAERLGYLAGRITEADAKIVQNLAKQYPEEMPFLLRCMQNPEVIQRLINEEKDNEEF